MININIKRRRSNMSSSTFMVSSYTMDALPSRLAKPSASYRPPSAPTTAIWVSPHHIDRPFPPNFPTLLPIPHRFGSASSRRHHGHDLQHHPHNADAILPTSSSPLSNPYAKYSTSMPLHTSSVGTYEFLRGLHKTQEPMRPHRHLPQRHHPSMGHS